MIRFKRGSTSAGTKDRPASRRRTFAAVALCSAALALTGCTSGSPEPSSTEAPTAASATWDAAGHAAAQAAGAKVLRTWSRPTLAYESWWADLAAQLSPEAQQVYEYTDPAQIPSLKITGPGVESNNDNPHVVTITFPTTAGEFGVDLSRTKIPGKWIGESIIFPGEVSRLQG